MSIYLSNLSEAYGPLLSSHREKRENPQHYDELKSQEVHPSPHRHVLGLVGGNEVSVIKGNQADLESDLRGINIPNTFCPSRQYQPPHVSDKQIVRENTKVVLNIDVQKHNLPAYQMFAYPSVVGPLPMVNEVCQKPEKY